ncbi:iron-sulfur cluster assembly scaffold protein [Paenibacillus sp. GSMTC-2017]|uniref:iron-sulfur cluster assembly scaffold protein n=1 Tax=Paenibacillus sp. GSMTC-2017 TaxID=2794350 RepID=UPI0018D73E7E|nr:iron-sulfur cluster assembly scaffold protein [Paenibacillus sp. GSMTC-2017]MBH5318815.1 iron-sulfur cluster assembly scaffold protein [Paenibacillus sp. GSMTC-2017]
MYNSIIVDHFTSPRNIGELEDRDEEISIGNPVCGDTIHLHLKKNDKTIVDVKFKAYGCATSIATASVFSEYIKNKTIDQIRETVNPAREEMLGELEPSQRHCLDILAQLFGHFDRITA